jgi:septal ring factor EnvC (AmiA/AmiB activator)
MGIKDRERTMMERGAASVTKWVGSTVSILLHTLLFVGTFAAPYLGLMSFERMLLMLTTIVSLEAIYLSIFIQMSINMSNETIEIIQEDIEEIGDDIEEIQKDVDEIQEDVDEIQEDVDEIQEEAKEELANEKKETDILISIQSTLMHLQTEIEQLKISNK